MASTFEALLLAQMSLVLNPPLAVLTQSAIQNIANATSVAMNFDASVADTYSGHSTVTNNTRYTCQVAGWYYVTATAGWAIGATGNRLIMIYKNGSPISYNQVAYSSIVATNSPAEQAVGLVQMIVGDYVEIWVYQTNGGALNMSPVYGTMQVRFVHQ